MSTPTHRSWQRLDPHSISRYSLATPGRVPKRTKGTDCKSVIRGFESHLGLFPENVSHRQHPGATPRQIIESLHVTPIIALPDNVAMPSILLIVLIVLVLLSFGGGFARPAYRTHGISLGTVLLIVLLLWIFGVFGPRPY